ncbi:MAG: choice-of-anchor P family protein [Candidatus Acidiferrum sp.]
MNTQDRIPFHFHAEGHAFSAHFVRPVDVPIAAQAATSLPTVGGHAHAHVENFHVPRLIDFKSGSTHVSGSWQDEKTVTTSATAALEDVKLLDYLTADRIVARLTAEYTSHTTNRDGHILALGSHFKNLRLGGQDIKVKLRHDLLLKSATFTDLRNNLADDAKSGRITVIENGVALCSLVEEIVIDPKALPGVQVRGHILRIPHFGEVALAEIFATPGTIALTMLRFNLGSPDGGVGTMAETRTNGQPLPPMP